MQDVKLILKNHKPYGIRDKNGFLFFFSDIRHYTNQDERYREEIDEQFRLADDLVKFLETR